MRFTGVGVDTISGMRGSSGGVAAGPPALRCASRQSIRLAANKHRSTVPDVTTVTAILIRPATAVETADIGRSVSRSDFGLRFLAAMVILGRVRLHGSLIRTLPCQVDPDLSPASHAGSMKRLSEVVNQTLPMGMVYRFLRSHFPGGEDVLTAALWSLPNDVILRPRTGDRRESWRSDLSVGFAFSISL
jgi:hypothetical protein